MTSQQNGRHASEFAFRASVGDAGHAINGMMPLVGLMVLPFPEPGPVIRTSMEQLQQATVEPPADEQELRMLAHLPRPWDPATCTGPMRTELWMWLDSVATWVNEQHLWKVTCPGVPECWPAHPHLVNDLAVLACSRYYTSFAVTPAALEDWHRYGLPGFLERLRDRLGNGCQPGNHQPWPRRQRDGSHSAMRARRSRKRRYRDDVDRAGEAVTSPPEGAKPDHDALHDWW